jgi:peptide/nickel transport system substrate-binding protein
MLHQADVGHIPLHHQVIPWATRKNITAVHHPNNQMWTKWVNVN